MSLLAHLKQKWVLAVTIIVALPIVVIATLVAKHSGPYDLDIVDVIVSDWGDEARPNPEPTLAVDAADPNRIAVTALDVGYTSGAATFCPAASDATITSSDSGGVLLSTDGGTTWSYRCLLPAVGTTWTGDEGWPMKKYGAPVDVTLGFTGKAGTLAGAYLSPYATLTGRVAIVSQWADASAVRAAWWNANASPMEDSDQPQLAVMPNGSDAQFVVGAISHQQSLCANGSVLWQHKDGQPYVNCVNTRPSDLWWSFVRAAIHASGRLYVLIARAHEGNDYSYDLVVRTGSVATDGAVTFAGPADAGAEGCGTDTTGAAGNRMLCDLPFLTDQCPPGDNRLGSNQFALSIDPRNDEHVVIAYGKAKDGINHLYLAESTDGGKSISAPFFDADSAVNPAVAVDADGRVAILFQQLSTNESTGDEFWTTIVRVFDVDRTATTDYVLASHPVKEPAHVCADYPLLLGDYVTLRAVGTTFYGVFTANNNPYWNPSARFLRDKSRLVSAPTSSSQVRFSIDPFFFKLTRRGFGSRMTAWIGSRRLPYPDDARIPAAVKKIPGPRF